MGNQKGKPVLRDEDISTLTKSSGMTEEQIKESYEKFVKDHPKGDFHIKIQIGFDFDLCRTNDD